MKAFKINFTTVAAVLSIVGMSCSREIPNVGLRDTNLTASAIAQVFAATVKSARTYVYIDGTPVSGAAVAAGGVFPATAYGFKVLPGSHSVSIKDTLVGTTQIPITFTQQFDAGKSYTTFIYDTITSVKQVTVENKISIPTDTTSRLRFGNFVYNSTGAPAVDVYSFKRGPSTPVFANVANAAVTDFIPYASALTDTLYVYAAGTTTPLLAKSFVSPLTVSRSYTSVFNGSFNGTKAVTTFVTY